MAKLGGRPSFPMIKATNVVTSRPAGALGLGAPTSGGRLLLIMPWKGAALIGTSHSDVPVEPGDTSVSPAELGAFLDEINSAFPALHLAPAAVTLVHRGVVPAERQEDGTLGLMGHHQVHDHAADGVAGALSVVGVKYTTARGVAEQVVDRVAARLGMARLSCLTGTTLLPGAFTRPLELEISEAVHEAGGLLGAECLAAVVRTHGTEWRRILGLCREDAALCEPVSTPAGPPAAVLVNAIRREMARTLVDVVVRRTNIGAAGLPDAATVARCAHVAAKELGWDAATVDAEVARLRAFYSPV
jgi:glycerol-3-phosphate dehydrogenase